MDCMVNTKCNTFNVPNDVSTSVIEVLELKMRYISSPVMSEQNVQIQNVTFQMCSRSVFKTGRRFFFKVGLTTETPCPTKDLIAMAIS